MEGQLQMTQITITTEEYEHLKDRSKIVEDLTISYKANLERCNVIECSNHWLNKELEKEQQKNRALKNSLIGKFILWLKGYK